MAPFGHKKRRASRTIAMRPVSSFWRQVGEGLRNRRLMLRLSMCVAAVAALVAVVEAWKSSFPYRKGDIPEHGITAKIDFERINKDETNRARAEAKARVGPIFRHDPALLDPLSKKFRGSLNDVAQAASVDTLRSDTRAAFGLTVAEGVDRTRTKAGESKPEVMNQEFAALKAAISGEDGTAGNRIDVLIGEFERFIQPVRRHGLADANDLRQHEPEHSRPIGIIRKGSDGLVESVPQSDVLLNELVGDTGLLGKSWGQFSDLSVMRTMVNRWLVSQAPTTLTYDSEASQLARLRAVEQVPDATIQYDVGDLLVPAGEPIDEEDLAVLRAEYDQMERMAKPFQRAIRVAIATLLIVMLFAMIGYYLVRNERHLVRSSGRLGVYLTAVVVTVLLARFVSYEWRAEVVPLMATVMVLAVAYNQQLAALTAFGLALVITLSTTHDMTDFAILMSVGTASVIPLASVPSRSKLILVGFGTAIVAFVVSAGAAMVQSQSFAVLLNDTDTLMHSLVVAGWCLVAGYLVAGSLPFVERAFGVVTDISLLEMSDISHPLLQQLVARAPGTYNHSISVAAIAEAAAEKIGANGLLVRIGAYYHDIGKMLKPQYFIENMTEGSRSRHEHLAPAMSTLIIIGHVKDGVDLANQHNLPQPLVDLIEQHHGTTLVEYFYHEATKQAGIQPDHRTDAEESSFRYPGPKPQTREAGVLMIADAVEGASRTLSEPTPRRIETLVHDITMKRLLDGQFDECSLTLNELHEIEESVVKSLTAIYHGRIKYPEQRTA